MKITKKNRMVILLFLLPALVVYLVWVVWPIIEAIYMSMLKWETLNTTRFTGFDNYVSVFKSRLFYKSLVNSLVFMVATTAIQVVLGFFYGYLVYLQPKGYRIYKIFLFVPTVLPSVAVGFIWCYIYSPGMGVLKPIMEAIGLGQY